MKNTFAITTHVPVDRIADWMVAHGFAAENVTDSAKIDADIELIMSLIDGTPVTFEYEGLTYGVRYVGALDAYDVSLAPATH